MISPLDVISPVALGERLRKAREHAGLKQADVAETVKLARTTLLAIEQGQRRVRIDELQALAKRYGTSVNALVREEAVFSELVPQFRKLISRNEDAVEEAAQILSDLAKADVELENLLGVKRARNYPPERPILPGDVRVQAEQDAQELRQRLGLGNAPILDIVTLLELDLGVRVYIRRLDSQIAGLFAYDDGVGACMLLNANHPRDRRRQTAGHETGHLVATRRQPEVLKENEAEKSREERYAGAFGRAFLTPARAVMQKFSEITAGSSRLTRRHIIVLAHVFGISREAAVRRLEELKLAKEGTWDWFVENGGISDEQVRQVLGDLAAPDDQMTEADRPTTLRLMLLATEAARQGLLSEGQLSRMLRLDRIELRKMLDETTSQGHEADGTLLPH